MLVRLLKQPRLWALLAGLGALAAAGPVQGQYLYPNGSCAPPPYSPYPGGMVPLAPLTPAPQGMAPAAPSGQAVPPRMPPADGTTRPQAQPGEPSTGQVPQPGAEAAQQPGAEAAGQAQAPGQTEGENAAASAAAEAAAAPSTGGAAGSLGGEALAATTGYIDSAIPFTHFRLRFDAAYDDNRPDRAEFFYPECGCNNKLTGPGPNKPETRVDYQEISSYLELALSNRASAFVEVPVRFLNPEQNDNATGLGDMNAGFKFAMIASPDTFLTFQLRTYFPTGEASRGLGNGLTTLEPALLWHQQMGDRFALDTELRDWIPLNTSAEFQGSTFAGNVIRYGVGVSYLALNNPRFRIIPVAEIVGWTVLSGEETEVASAAASELLLAGAMTPGLANVRSAAGDTIVNAKIGARFGFGSFQETGFLSRSDLYVGYGRALTGDVWYKDILRVEYRVRF